jgi:hypothetical protein
MVCEAHQAGIAVLANFGSSRFGTGMKVQVLEPRPGAEVTKHVVGNFFVGVLQKRHQRHQFVARGFQILEQHIPSTVFGRIMLLARVLGKWFFAQKHPQTVCSPTLDGNDVAQGFAALWRIARPSKTRQQFLSRLLEVVLVRGNWGGVFQKQPAEKFHHVWHYELFCGFIGTCFDNCCL